MAEARQERRLAAIMMADIVGYTRLMNSDERGTHQRVQRLLQQLVEPTIIEHRGRLVKSQGDGFLVMFDSPVEAVRCAIVIQQSMIGRNLEMELPRDRWIQFRIGVNVGDVIVEPDDIYGDGVNVAQRLESLADPGSIYISGSVYEQIRYKLVCGYQNLGDKRVKNILDPVPTYRVLPDPHSVAKATWRGRARMATVAGGTLAIVALAGFGWWYWTEERPQEIAAATPRAPPAPAQPIAAPSPPPAPVVPPPSPPPVASAPPAPVQPVATPTPAPSPPPPEPIASPPPAPAIIPPIVQPPPAQQATKGPPPHEEKVAMVIPPLKPTAEPRVEEPEMVPISGGTFRMGSADDPSEQPIHPVTIKPFLISKSLIMVGQWRDCVRAKACAYEPKESDRDEAPINNISWNDTQQYIGWLSKATGRVYRLPSEAEWEYAARGGTETKFWWGNTMKPGYANCTGCGSETGQPMRVDLHPTNPYGIHINDGSLGEWVADCWIKDYHGAFTDDSPRMLPDCRARVLRGGSWRNDASYVRSSSRDWYDASVRYPTHGFRVARSQ